MVYAYYDVLSQTRQWAEQAVADGYLNPRQAQALFDMEEQSTQPVFSDTSGLIKSNPLLVAFMGGTGVGKSSLLNRLAGQPIAKAGLERPTSKEVTLYHHQARSVQHLPEGLPLESIKLSRHDNAAQAHIIWMDMPDFDSIELGNHQLVRQWLPHIDVLIYVVSPERYRDNKTWQLLLSERVKHAWLFIMNQWDRGLDVQYEDFKQQLHLAGFSDPLLFRTSCTEPEGDEFADLLAKLESLSERHSVEQLEQYSRQVRNTQLRLIVLQLEKEIADRDFSQLRQFYIGIWQKTELAFAQGLAWPLQYFAQLWAAQPGQKPDIKLWDDWAQSLFDDVLDDLTSQAAILNIPCKPLRNRLQSLKNQAEKKIRQQIELSGRMALLNPGNPLQRILLKFTAVCETLLPLTAMGIVGYQVVRTYYQSAGGNSSYLGMDFAIHSILLITLSWLLPFFLHKKMQPSLEKNTLRGLQKGLQQALADLNQEILAVLTEEQSHTQALKQDLAQILTECQPVIQKPKTEESLLGRVLINAHA